MASSYNVIIKFKDGTEMEIQGASNFKTFNETRCFAIEKNGYYSFYPMENVVYIGRTFDLEN